jgi:hypothetical protein
MIIQQLLVTFENYSSAGEDDDEAAFGATECLETITTVLEVIKENATAVGAVEGMLTPLLFKIFSTDDMIEYIENGIEIISYLTYYPDNINSVTTPPSLSPLSSSRAHQSSRHLSLLSLLFVSPVETLGNLWTNDCSIRWLGI